jgi:hypothetical protein
MRTRILLSALLMLGLSISACEGASDGETTPPDPAETTAAVNDSVQLALSEAAESFEFLNDSEMTDELFGLLGDDSDTMACASIPPFDENGEPMYDGWEDPCDDMQYEDEGGEGFDIDWKDGAKEAAEWVGENVFTDANFEEVDGNSVIYLLPASLLCDLVDGDEPDDEGGNGGGGFSAGMPDMDCSCPEEADDEACEAHMQECMDSMGDWPSEEDPGPPMEQPDDEQDGKSCEEIFTEVPLRLKVTASGSGHTIDLLVGDAKANPASAFLASDELSLELDFAGVTETWEILADAMGEDMPPMPETLEGRVKLGLKKNATDNYTVALSVVKAIHVAMDFDGESFNLQLAATEPTIAITADGNAKALSIDADLGALDVSLPAGIFGGEDCYVDEWGYEECDGDDGPDGTLGIHLGGASASITLSSGDEGDSLTVTNVGLGDTTTTATYDGAQIVGIDLNADHGRRLDLAMTTGEELFTIGVNPALVLEVALDFANAGEMAEDAPAWTMDEDLTASLTGSSPAISFSDEQMRVESGTLTLSATSADDVAVEAGMCMEGGDSGDGQSIGLGSSMEAPDGAEDPFMPEEEDEGDEDEHPFANMEAVQCE